ncbi:MAG: cobalamin-dependent protein [Desulfobacterales bacterium]|nr:MAG: cobalamin-dependent protein [Desulfobacterales bacterium]
MKCLLINPFYPISETPSPPLGLAYLAAALEAAGIGVKILDLVVYPYSQKKLEALLNHFKPQLVGITAVTMTVENALNVITDIKRINPEILSVMGGPHVTFCARQTLAENPELDFIALGEGENTIVELSREAEGRRNWDTVKGIAFRRDSEICFTPDREFIQDLDTLPTPARHLLPLGRYRALGMPVSLTTSRGCPFKCIFCVGRKMVGAKVRYRNPQHVVNEMEYLNTLNFHQINIADDLFTANKTHCVAVCDEILDRNLQMKWTSFARVDTVSEEILSRMKAAGCTAVSFGIESANPEILKTIKKGITPRQVVDAVDICHRVGVTPFGSFILGLPGETQQTIKETVDFGNRLKKRGLSFGFHLLAPFPGTEVREQGEKYDISILTNDWSQYHANRAIVETPTVNRKMLDKIVTDWENEYDGYLEDIKNRMKKGQATADEVWELKNLQRIVLIYDLMMKNVIEEKGAWKTEKKPMSETEAINALVDSIKNLTDSKSDEIYETLSYAIQQGTLNFSVKEGQIKWEWVDYL